MAPDLAVEVWRHRKKSAHRSFVRNPLGTNERDIGGHHGVRFAREHKPRFGHVHPPKSGQQVDVADVARCVSSDSSMLVVRRRHLVQLPSNRVVTMIVVGKLGDIRLRPLLRDGHARGAPNEKRSDSRWPHRRRLTHSGMPPYNNLVTPGWTRRLHVDKAESKHTMVTQRDRGRLPGMNLRNETAINVAGLLREPIGGTRSYPIHLDAFPLDDDLRANDVEGDIKLTRLRDAVMASVRVGGEAVLECARCLRAYPQPFRTEVTEEFRQTVDLRTGIGLDRDLTLTEDDEESTIDENHEMDLGEVLRQEILVALPMRPDCGAACPGPDTVEVGDPTPIDDRFAALSHLLDDEPDGRNN